MRPSRMSAELRGPAVILKMHVPAVWYWPPESLACGSGYTFEVTLVNGAWNVNPIEVIVC